MSDQNVPAVAVVTVSYNTRALLRQCLESAIHAEIPARVIVVDNASADGSAAMVRAAFPQVDLIANDRNAGFAAGTNQGIRRALDDSGVAYVLLLNPDAYLRPGALAAMTAFLEAHPRVGCVGARLFYADGSAQEGAWHFPSLWMTLFDLFPPRGPLIGWLYGSPLNGRYREERGAEPFPIDHPLGAAMLIRRETLESVGLLDEGYWMYVEEVDWCYRCRAAGWAIWQVPQAEVVHVGGASTRQIRSRSFEALHRSRMQFWARFYDPRRRRWNRRLLLIGMLWASLMTWRDRLRGQIDGDTLRANLLAYGWVLRIARDSSA